MRVYESLFIINPSSNEEEINKTVEQIQNTIISNGGEVIKIDRWGKRPLAYQIKKQKEGYYVLLNFHADTPALGELERRYKLTDQILRHNIIKLGDKPGDLPPGYGQYNIDTQFVDTEYSLPEYDDYDKEGYDEEGDQFEGVE